MEFEVEPGAPFMGREVRELGLPSGCILVRCYADGREWVPTAATRLNSHTRITAVITPEATERCHPTASRLRLNGLRVSLQGSKATEYSTSLALQRCDRIQIVSVGSLRAE